MAGGLAAIGTVSIAGGIPAAAKMCGAKPMKFKAYLSTATLCAALVVSAAGGVEAKMSTTKKVMIGAGVVAAVGGGALLMKTMAAKSKSADESTGSIRPRKAVGVEEPVPARNAVKRGVDQTVTGSVTRATARESCQVKAVDLFDNKGFFVKSERMRVCQ